MSKYDVRLGDIWWRVFVVDVWASKLVRIVVLFHEDFLAYDAYGGCTYDISRNNYRSVEWVWGHFRMIVYNVILVSFSLADVCVTWLITFRLNISSLKCCAWCGDVLLVLRLMAMKQCVVSAYYWSSIIVCEACSCKLCG